MQIGLVGLQYSGKTTLFNTLAGIEMQPGGSMKEEATIEVVKVPDERLDKLSAIFNPKKQVNATIEVFDTPGLRMQDDGKVKITNVFLNNVKNNDALFYVIRQFEDDTVAHPMNSINPVRDIQFLESEFLLSDLAFLENRIEKLKKETMKSKDENLKKEQPVIEKCYAHAESEKPLRSLALDENERKFLSGYQLLTLKPLTIAVIFDENTIADAEKVINDIQTKIGEAAAHIIPFSAKIENELANLEEEDRKVFMADYGIKESALTKILRTSYEILGLQSFFTVGEDEVRAWTCRKGDKAPQAAGKIHSDMEKGFIRMEVIRYEDLIELGSEAAVSKAGRQRIEGKDYVVQDGDVVPLVQQRFGFV